MILGNDNHELDEIDVMLVAALQVDCKTPLQRLGDLVGLTAPSVMERIRKLEQAGVIRGYHALLDARSVGLDVTAFIGVSFNYPKKIHEFEAWVASEPRVLECHHVTGDHTLLMKARTRNTKDLEALISGIRAIEGVERTQTMIVLSTHTERAQLPLGVEAPTLTQRGDRQKRQRKRNAAPEEA